MIQNPSFEFGVVKLQKGLHNELDENEKNAVCCLLKGNFLGELSPEAEYQEAALGMKERLAKRRKNEVSNDQYVNCDFILGSAAEVERLWSIAKYVLTENTRSMTPQMFEALMFLRLNERFWDEQLVSEAINGARSDCAAARLGAHEVWEENFN